MAQTQAQPSTAPFTVTTGVASTARYAKVLIYGNFGSGKTVLAAEAVDVPSMRDVLLINVEGGEKSIENSGAVVNHHDIDIIRVTEYKTFPIIHKMLVEYCRARDANDTARIEAIARTYNINPARRYKTVIVDSIYELDGMNFRRLIGDNSLDLMQATSSDDLRGDYGRNRQIIHKALRAMRDLPMNVIFTAPADEKTDEVTKRTKIGPMLTGKLSKDIQGFMDVVGFLVTAQNKTQPQPGVTEGPAKISRRLWLQSMGRFDAKCRLTSQDVTHIDEPTMGMLMSTLYPNG